MDHPIQASRTRTADSARMGWHWAKCLYRMEHLPVSLTLPLTREQITMVKIYNVPIIKD